MVDVWCGVDDDDASPVDVGADSVWRHSGCGFLAPIKCEQIYEFHNLYKFIIFEKHLYTYDHYNVSI